MPRLWLDLLLPGASWVLPPRSPLWVLRAHGVPASSQPQGTEISDQSIGKQLGVVSVCLRDEQSKWEILTPVSSGPTERQPPSNENKHGVGPAQGHCFLTPLSSFLLIVSVVLRKSHP